ncbi:hypothetical protein MSG28_009550 [Choristoneura fumiferana]|uniref:Uncharacterized protein n=1 Tax=Choristoneura fumiferana TaxID=7141 RepID=A0ACC0JBW3_CHOFU|nr:hypothetical protein MSG28_009550 [Choristoneura fumiferana]
MVSKVLGLFVFAAVATLGSSELTQIFLEDESLTFITNPLIGKSLTIPKFVFDTLQSCHVVLPSGVLVEVFPNNELDDPYITFLDAVEPFRSCGIGFHGAPVSHSGTYELYSMVQDWANSGLSLTRKKFHLTLVESDPWHGEMSGSSSINMRVRRERRRLVAGELMQDFAQNTTLHGLGYIADKKLSTIENVLLRSSKRKEYIVGTQTKYSEYIKQPQELFTRYITTPQLFAEQVELIIIVFNVLKTFINVIISNNEKEQASVKKRVRRERRQLVAGELVQDFAQNTTLHGLRYIAEKRLSLVENSNNEKEQASVKKRVRRERRQLVAGELVQDFAQNTTLHGLRYIAEKRLSLVENDDTEDSMLYEAVCLILGLPNEMTPKPFNVRIVEKIFEVSPNIDDILHSCNLYGSIGDCKELFNPVLTMEGRSTYSRPDASIILKHENEDVSRFYNTNNDGFKVFLHHPADLPQSSVFFYAAPNEQRISLGLKLSITNTSSSLRTYAADTRRCYFPGERELRYFHTYTDNNCKLECLSNYTLQLLQYDEREGDYNRGGQCRCYPLCLNIQFTRIEMFYKTPKIVPMRRSELFGMTDFFANCGGLLGLFLGFSFLSILEIVYFCTLSSQTPNDATDMLITLFSKLKMKELL